MTVARIATVSQTILKNMQRPPLVSVVMTVFNAAFFLRETIESILRQTLTDFEFIIVDDGSTDNSADLIRRCVMLDPRIRPMFGMHRGQGAAANAGIAEARGEYIARMDSDDIALPERLATQLAWMDRRGVEICGCQVQTLGGEDTEWWYPETHPAIINELLFRVGLMQPSAILRADILRANPYDEHVAFDDYELWTRLAPHYTMGNVPEVLLRYRRHEGQIHVVNAQQNNSDFRRFRFRYFYTLYPGTPLPDYLALARVSDHLPMTSLFELERAGRWLVDLAQPPESKLRARMSKRWQETCDCSVSLGTGVVDLRTRFQEEIDRLGSAGVSNAV
jgi:glycosyltransferase involved in cell wall biosynthesis